MVIILTLSKICIKKLTIMKKYTLYIQLFDSFAAQEGDYTKDYDRWYTPQVTIEDNMNAPLLAFWILQFQRNYKPFRTVFTFKLDFTITYK